MSDTDIQTVIDSLAALRKEVAILTEAQSDLGGRLDMFDLRLDGLESRMDTVETNATLQDMRLDGMESAGSAPPPAVTAAAADSGPLEPRLETVESWCENLVARMQNVDESFLDLRNKVDRSEAVIGGMDDRLLQSASSVSEFDGQLGGVQARMNGLESRVDQLKDRVEELQAKTGV